MNRTTPIGDQRTPTGQASGHTQVMLGNQPVLFPLEIQVNVPVDRKAPPESRVFGANGTMLAQFVASIEDMIREQAEASVWAEANALVTRLEETRVRAENAAIAARVPAAPTAPDAPNTPPQARTIRSWVPAISTFEVIATAGLLAILGGIAITSLHESRVQSDETRMRSWLEYLAFAQEEHFAAHRQYGESVEATHLEPPEDVDVAIHDTRPAGYTGTARARTTGVTCRITVTTARYEVRCD